MKNSVINVFVLILFIGLLVGCDRNKDNSLNMIDETTEVLDQVEQTKISTAQFAADELKRDVQTYYYTLLIEMASFDEIIFTCSEYGCLTENETLDLSGTIPTSGTITINANGTIEFKDIVINGYNCEISNSGASICK